MAVSKLLILRSRADWFCLENAGISLNLTIPPQPLLIRLGSLLTDIPETDVFQRHREPQTWQWPNEIQVVGFITHEPPRIEGPPALVLSLSATLTDDRIIAAMGVQPTLWKVEVPDPYNDFLKSRAQLREFRTLIRGMMDRIKATHGQHSLLHVFPAVPISIAIELGRIRQPKADMKWRIYDQVNELKGFIPALEIS